MSDFVTTPSGLKYKIVRAGNGPKPQQGAKVDTHYSGWLDGFNGKNQFDSSRTRGKPFSFQAGIGQVIKAWDEAILDMKVGEQRHIIVPPELGYGARGAGGVIPPNATLYFDMELIKA